MAAHAIHPVLKLLADGRDLSQDESTRTFQLIMNGGATPAQMAAVLMGLRAKGETIEEITGGATAMRAKAKHITIPKGAIDTCGTGGDSKGTYNISTAVAFVLAACDIPVVKHGNRSISSRSGSADVLSTLGVNTTPDIPILEQCIKKAGICFLMAPQFHPAMRYVAPIRQEIGLRTIFNLLGPLSNPGKPDFQLLGVYDKKWVEPIAHVLKELGCKAAWVVHGRDGLDELSLSDVSHVAELKDGHIRCFDISPEDANIEGASIHALKGGGPDDNARAMIEALSGAKSAYRNAVIYNAAAGLIIAGKADNLKSGAEIAADVIDSGRAHSCLKKLVEFSNERA